MISTKNGQWNGLCETSKRQAYNYNDCDYNCNTVVIIHYDHTVYCTYIVIVIITEITVININNFNVVVLFLQCFDTVGW